MAWFHLRRPVAPIKNILNKSTSFVIGGHQVELSSEINKSGEFTIKAAGAHLRNFICETVRNKFHAEYSDYECSHSANIRCRKSHEDIAQVLHGLAELFPNRESLEEHFRLQALRHRQHQEQFAAKHLTSAAKPYKDAVVQFLNEKGIASLNTEQQQELLEKLIEVHQQARMPS